MHYMLDTGILLAFERALSCVIHIHSDIPSMAVAIDESIKSHFQSFRCGSPCHLLLYFPNTLLYSCTFCGLLVFLTSIFFILHNPLAPPHVGNLHPAISFNRSTPPNLDPIHPLIHLSLSLSLSYPFTNVPKKYAVYSMLDQGGRDGQISLVRMVVTTLIALKWMYYLSRNVWWEWLTIVLSLRLFLKNLCCTLNPHELLPQFNGRDRWCYIVLPS